MTLNRYLDILMAINRNLSQILSPIKVSKSKCLWYLHVFPNQSSSSERSSEAFTFLKKVVIPPIFKAKICGGKLLNFKIVKNAIGNWKISFFQLLKYLHSLRPGQSGRKIFNFIFNFNEIFIFGITIETSVNFMTSYEHIIKSFQKCDNQIFFSISWYLSITFQQNFVTFLYNFPTKLKVFIISAYLIVCPCSNYVNLSCWHIIDICYWNLQWHYFYWKCSV